MPNKALQRRKAIKPMAHLILAAGAGIILLLGTGHGVLALLDTVRPRYFTPTDEGVRLAMEGVRTAMQREAPVSPKANLWRAWLGFNLSHSLGIVVFGSALLVLAFHQFTAFAQSVPIQCSAAGIASAYLIISSRFWFWVPTAGFGAALACIVMAAVLA